MALNEGGSVFETSADGCVKLTVSIYVDNNNARKLAKTPVYHSRMKHIDDREAMKDGHLREPYILTEDIAADLLTMGLPGPKLEKCIGLVGLGVL